MILSVCPATSNLTLLGGDAILLPLYNPVPGTGHSQLRVLGSVNVASTVGLYVFENTPGALSASITAIDNDATDAVSGTFQNLPEGATFAVSDLRAARITYI